MTSLGCSRFPESVLSRQRWTFQTLTQVLPARRAPKSPKKPPRVYSHGFIMLSLRRVIVSNAARINFAAQSAVIARSSVSLPHIFQFRNFVTAIGQPNPSLSMNVVRSNRIVNNVVQPIYAREMSSTMKKRRSKMNKHKLKKRRKALRMNTKASRA